MPVCTIEDWNNTKRIIDNDLLILLNLDETQEYSYSEIYHSLTNLAIIKKEKIDR